MNYCCDKFREQVEDEMNISYNDYKGWNGEPKGWYINTDWDRDSQCEVRLEYCFFCGAKL